MIHHTHDYAKRFKEAGIIGGNIVYANYKRDNGTDIWGKPFLDEKHRMGEVKAAGYYVVGPAFNLVELIAMMPQQIEWTVRNHIHSFEIIVEYSNQRHSAMATTFVNALAEMVLLLINNKTIQFK